MVVRSAWPSWRSAEAMSVRATAGAQALCVRLLMMRLLEWGFGELKLGRSGQMHPIVYSDSRLRKL
jgi:hypothetical protein